MKVARTSTGEIIEKGLISFTTLLDTMKQENVEVTQDIVIGFIAGFQSGLKACGLDVETSISIAQEMTEILHALSGIEECGNCDNCKKKK